MSYTGKYTPEQIDPSSQSRGCPFCGAEKLEQVDYSKEVTIFNCWTKIALGQTNRGQMCYEHQIAQLQEQREAWKAYAHLLVEYYVNLSDRPDEKEQALLDRLRALGELP